MKKCMSKYDFTPSMCRNEIDYSEEVTVPDQVMSMYDIYMKYAVRGEIAGLADNIRPHVNDDLDMFDDVVDFVPEEDLDILQRSRAIRTNSSVADAEDKPQPNAGVEESGKDSDAKPQPSAGSESSGSESSGSDPGSNPGSE